MKKFLRNLIKKVGKKNFRTGFALIFCLPIMAWSFCNGGWFSLAAAIAGFFLGQLVTNKLFKD